MRDKKVISKNLLRKFLQEKRLAGIVNFLQFIKHKRNLHAFFDFLRKHNHAWLLPPAIDGVLFHGSSSVQNILTPKNSIGRGGKREHNAYVYATDDPNYAIFLAILRLRNGGASVNANMKNTILVVNLDFVNGPSKLKNGYVHILSATGFQKAKNREYRISQKVKILFAVPVTPTDLTVPIYIQTEP
jgi:hypothetical protein